MRQNLYTGKIFLSNSAKYKVFCMKMARIFRQCRNCCEKESSFDTVAVLVNRFGKAMKVRKFLAIQRYQ
jgi:hypothetical protein